MSREKQVYSREMVAHLWANRSQDSARDPGGRFYFTGARLFSYGSHFVIACHVDTVDGARVLWNDAGYSVTTGRHQTEARRALSSWQLRDALHVDGLEGDDCRGRGWLLKLAQRMAEDAGHKYAAARNVTRASIKRDSLADDARRYAAGALLLARTVAAGVGDAEGATAEDKRAARKLCAVLQSLPEYPENKDAQREACNAAAALLIREKTRRELAQRAAGAFRSVDSAQESRGWGRPDTALSHLGAAENQIRSVRDDAKLYGLRVPKLPDARTLAELRASLEPEARAYVAAAALERFRREYRDAERYARSLGVGHYRTKRDAENALELARAARAHGVTIPEWKTERLAQILRRCERYSVIEYAEAAVGDVAAAAKLADELREAGEMRRASSNYRSAIKDTERAIAGLPAGHPAWAGYPWITGAPHGGRLGAPYALDVLRQREAECRAAFAAEDAAALQAWRDSETNRVPGSLETVALRISEDGREIQTSRGATVPVSVAPLLWRLCNAQRDAGEPRAWIGDTGPRLGHFRLNEIHSDGGITAGCHEIPWAELQYIAGRLGYLAERAA